MALGPYVLVFKCHVVLKAGDASESISLGLMPTFYLLHRGPPAKTISGLEVQSLTIAMEREPHDHNKLEGFKIFR